MLTFSLNKNPVELAEIIGSIRPPVNELAKQQWSQMILNRVDREIGDVRNTDRYAYKMRISEMSKLGIREVPLAEELISGTPSKYGVFDEDDYADAHEAVTAVPVLADRIDYQGEIEHGFNFSKILLKAVDYAENGLNPAQVISDSDVRVCESLGIQVRDDYGSQHSAFLKAQRERLKAEVTQAQVDLVHLKRLVNSLCEPYRHSTSYANRRAITEIRSSYADDRLTIEDRIRFLQQELESLKPQKVVPYFDFVRLRLYEAGLDKVLQEALQNKHTLAGLLYHWTNGTKGYDPAVAVSSWVDSPSGFCL